MSHFESVLVANRGEIALRIMRTCRRMGLRTIAVFSDADANALHVRFADEAVRLGPAPARESYLSTEAILRAASLTGAEAIHPGYGFLSENHEFALACRTAGLNFIGPTPETIRAMGLKREAKALVAPRGVPLVPGFDGGDQSNELLKRKALEIGLPVIFKPSAGGGGKGMKIARTEPELDKAIESARREAQGAFGNSTLIIERYLERARHIEVQVLGDTHGNLVHLFERECSIQRRHQKVIEESPSAALTPETRAAICQTALEVARAVNYSNAGTVEMMLAQDGTFYFSEMNTRLQVEHRVTEMVTGLDLVEQQVRVARGERLGFSQADIESKGHAIEARLCAEDPVKSFFPCAGRVVDWHAPSREHVQVDTGVEAGAEISVHYDSMIAKVIAWSEGRSSAAALLARSLDEISVQGINTNRAFLAELLRHPQFIAGNLHTGFIAEHTSLTAARKDEARDALAAIAATLFAAERRGATHSGFRNNRWADQVSEYGVTYRALGNGAFLLNGEATWQLVRCEGLRISLRTPEGHVIHARVAEAGAKTFVHTHRGESVLKPTPRFPAPKDASVSGGFIAPMPGKVLQVNVVEGQTVKRGQPLLVLEAMKMEQTTSSPTDGTVKQVLVKVGEQVTAGQTLVVME